MIMKLIILQKKFREANGSLGPKMAHPLNSGSAVRIFLNITQWKGPIGRRK